MVTIPDNKKKRHQCFGFRGERFSSIAFLQNNFPSSSSPTARQTRAHGYSHHHTVYHHISNSTSFHLYASTVVMEKDSSKISMKQKEGSSSRGRVPILESEQHKSRQQQQVLSTPVSTAKEIVPLKIQPSPPKLKRKIYSSGNEQEENSSFMSSSFFSSERLNFPSFDEIFGSSSTFMPLNLRQRKCSLGESKHLSELLSHELSDLGSDDGESTFDDQEQSSHDSACDSSSVTGIRLVSAFERPSARRRG